MKALDQIAQVLREEPELWLDYLIGKRLDGALPNPSPKRFRVPTFIANAVWFTVWAIGKWSVRAPSWPCRRNAPSVFVLATSRNQIQTSQSSIEALTAGGCLVIGVSKKKHIRSGDDRRHYVPLAYSATDIARALLTFRTHGYALYRRLKTHPARSATQHFTEIAKVYLYLAYFYRTLVEVKPDCVLTSNDHSPLNRCMLAMAHALDIKTAYIQHASVSPAFPELLFDIAFLDGPAAAEVYAKCVGNRPRTLERHVETEIVYSGQKKRLTRGHSPDSNTIGIAINKLDDVNSVERLLSSMATRGLKTRVRWHPRQSPGDISQLKRLARQHPFQDLASLSDPNRESLDDFLGSIGRLIAGNSGIHLESAIRGVSPIYYEFSTSTVSDYYGFVKHGLARWARTEEELIGWLTADELPGVNASAVRYYSSTFQTEWEGREGELVATHLMSRLPTKG